ncbi:glycosyltransferase family 2 protein [Pseudarthrobacter sp. efr-133-R2A-89]|uniref:glycosyltransferase family 2 protein n=1 Tax=Pseudarthrobacter sp. efr-133-R2A-89 TaxID=3040302 RepID=UPI00255250C3|nr:glycosyltransferase family 2 protein [Pseudarthrobacter sp. efr-133-R2A-89]
MNSQSIDVCSPSDEHQYLLGISVVNYFSCASVAHLLRSLQDFAGTTKVLVTIVDNSQDEAQLEHKQLVLLAKNSSVNGLCVEVLDAGSNLGYGAGNNLGVNRLLERGASVVWVLNPDITVNGTAPELLQEVAKSQSSLWSTLTVEAGQPSYGLGEISTLTGRAKRSFNQEPSIKKFSVCYPGGHSILSRADTWKMAGGFDDNYFLFMEEADLTLRSIELGIHLGTLKSVSVEHDQGLTTGSTNNIRTKSRVAFLESTKSRVIFFRKFYPKRLPILVISRIVYMLVALAKGNLDGAKAVGAGLLRGVSMPIKREVKCFGGK